MITVKLFDKYNNLLFKAERFVDEKVTISFHEYSTATKWVRIDSETNEEVEGKVNPVIIL